MVRESQEAKILSNIIVRAALQRLRQQLDREKLRSEIQESVRKCARADRAENRVLAGGAVSRHG